MFNIPANRPTLHKDIFISYNITLETCRNIRKWIYFDTKTFDFITVQPSFTYLLQVETVFLLTNGLAGTKLTPK